MERIWSTRIPPGSPSGWQHLLLVLQPHLWKVVGHVGLGKVVWFFLRTDIWALSTYLRSLASSLNQDHQQEILTFCGREGQCCPHLDLTAPTDLKFSSLVIMARVPCVDHLGLLGFQQDLSHSTCTCTTSVCMSMKSNDGGLLDWIKYPQPQCSEMETQNPFSSS